MTGRQLRGMGRCVWGGVLEGIGKKNQGGRFGGGGGKGGKLRRVRMERILAIVEVSVAGVSARTSVDRDRK